MIKLLDESLLNSVFPLIDVSVGAARASHVRYMNILMLKCYNTMELTNTPILSLTGGVVYQHK